ncbi:hypothetical protein [Bradyrhizobium sp. URHC0002]
MPWTLSLFLALERSTFDRTYAPSGESAETAPRRLIDPAEREQLGKPLQGLIEVGWGDLLFILLSRSANHATDSFQMPRGRVVKWERQATICGVDPKFHPKLSLDGNSFIVSWPEQNI